MSITEAQLREVATQMFEQIDANKNGALEKDEVKAFSQRMMTQLKPDSTFDEAKFEENFQKLDKNQDGKVSFDELFKSLVEKAKSNGVLAEWTDLHNFV